MQVIATIYKILRETETEFTYSFNCKGDRLLKITISLFKVIFGVIQGAGGGGVNSFQNHEIMLTLSGDVYFFVPNIVHSTLFSEQHSLFDPRDNNKSNQTYFYKNSVRFTTASAFLVSGPFYPTRVVGWLC